MNVRTLAEKYEQYVIDCRHWIHQHPETAWQEWETMEFIENELHKMGLETYRFDNEHTGGWAWIRGGKGGPNKKAILLRAEIDALPVQEKNDDIPYKSIYPNRMHACGHDSHVAMLLGAAKILTEIKDELEGDVKLLFQPAEEPAVGAKWCVDQGCMDDVDACYGCHIATWLESPYISVEEGPRMAASDEFKIHVNGVGCHGGMPHLGRDPIVAACSIVMNLQTLVSRRTDSLDSLVITIGKITGGQHFNVVTDYVEINGTARSFSREIRANIQSMMAEVAENTAKALGCTASVEYKYNTPAVIHDSPLMNRIAMDAALKLYGPEGVKLRKPVAASDDFSYFSEVKPGLFAFIGACNEEKDCAYGHHHPKFNIDEDAFVRGTAMYAQVAIDFLADKENSR